MNKNHILFVIFLLSALTVVAQEENSRNFGYRSFSISPLGIFSSPSGLILKGDVSFDYGKNIFSLGLGTGTEGEFIGNSDSFSEVNLMYGRSWFLNEDIFMDVYAGAGYFRYISHGFIEELDKKGEIKENTIGFPFGAKFQYVLGPRFSLGLYVGANLNSINSIGSLGLVLQWNRKRSD